MNSFLVMAAAEPTETWGWLAKAEDIINSIFDPLATAVASVIFWSPTIGGVAVPVIVFWLVIAALVFTIYFRGIQFTGWRTSLDCCAGSTHDRRTPVR